MEANHGVALGHNLPLSALVYPGNTCAIDLADIMLSDQLRYGINTGVVADNEMLIVGAKAVIEVFETLQQKLHAVGRQLSGLIYCQSITCWRYRGKTDKFVNFPGGTI